ncbi:hypothetical protein [Rhizobium sp. 11515TR]|uniref:hypothetical protein n=1 Tax=Rhizobium sp. 11515TR TaxID=2028343 RepID=UPI000BA8839A|nr:hypothetical protein [Rhizobium sp. 11515TR]ASW06274.1 hypothetical protein CKA34_10515 [Rhizobium sp. 11515TR]
MRKGLKDRVLRIHRENPTLPVADIAKQIGAVPQYVTATLRRNGITPPRKPTKVPVPIGVTAYFTPEVCSLLRKDAERRRISVNQLIKSLVYAVARDGMVDAVLDDQAEAEMVA